MSGMTITMIGRDGYRWPVHGPGRLRGITLSEGGVQGLMDAPFETDWIDDTDGTRFAGERPMPRDLTLGFYLSDDLAQGEAGQIESDFRSAFTTRLDEWDPNPRLPRIEVAHGVQQRTSGPRWLDVHLRAAPAMKMERDPYSQRVYDIVYELRAVSNLYDSEPDMDAFETAGSSGSGFVTVSNPTDMPMRHTWILTPGDWVLPDPSWSGGPGERVPGGSMAGRTVPISVTVADGGARVTRERRTLHASTLNGTNLLGRMQGMWVRHDIPPYTPPTQLPISVTNAPAGGARAELRMPRRWSRPLGLELGY